MQHLIRHPSYRIDRLNEIPVISVRLVSFRCCQSFCTEQLSTSLSRTPRNVASSKPRGTTDLYPDFLLSLLSLRRCPWSVFYSILTASHRKLYHISVEPWQCPGSGSNPQHRAQLNWLRYFGYIQIRADTYPTDSLPVI
jgi:hypothetical protein